ncbi:hypothetical protein L3X38_031271 [Prunus dulcis]|uniref:Uncharacterized protein n=1 Tax=Prunus dulcis TaxID=3755 RepID=A0AAD4VBS7_PRUDU|nr:hypothetical protein L3X38_031271 [Prunus dulcis]
MPSLISTLASTTKSKLLFRKPRWVSNRAVAVECGDSTDKSLIGGGSSEAAETGSRKGYPEKKGIKLLRKMFKQMQVPASMFANVNVFMYVKYVGEPCSHACTCVVGAWGSNSSRRVLLTANQICLSVIADPRSSSGRILQDIEVNVLMSRKTLAEESEINILEESHTLNRELQHELEDTLHPTEDNEATKELWYKSSVSDSIFLSLIAVRSLEVIGNKMPKK